MTKLWLLVIRIRSMLIRLRNTLIYSISIIAVYSRSGRCDRHLQSLYQEFVRFKNIVITVRNTDFINTDNAQLISYDKDLSDNIPESNIKRSVKFVDILPSKDHNV